MRARRVGRMRGGVRKKRRGSAGAARQGRPHAAEDAVAIDQGMLERERDMTCDEGAEQESGADVHAVEEGIDRGDVGPPRRERHAEQLDACLLYTSPSPRDRQKSRM